MDSNLVKFLGEFEKHKGEFIIVESIIRWSDLWRSVLI
jgi:hypothetical protein